MPAVLPKDTATTEYIEGKDGAIEVRTRSKGSRTLAQKAEAKAEHDARIVNALAALETAEGMAAYLVAGFITGYGEKVGTGYRVTAGNLALIALQAPGQEVRRYGPWKAEGCPVRKGVKADVWLTGGKAMPVANWSGDAVGAPRLDIPLVDRPTCEGLAASWREWPDHSLQGVKAWEEAIGPAFIESADGIEVGREGGGCQINPNDLF